MNTFSSSNDRWWEDHIEAFVDGTLNPDEHTRFESLIKRDPTAAREVELAGSIQKALRSLSSTECPDYVTKTIIRNVRVGIFDHARRMFAETVSGYFGTLLRPAITMAVFLVIVLASVWSGPSTNRPVEPVVAEALKT